MGHGRARSAVALIVIAGFAFAGCGGGAHPGPVASTKAATLVSTLGGFSLRYPVTWVKIEPTPDPVDDPGLVYQVYLADPTGAKSGSRALDVLGVAVRRLSRTAKPGDLRAHRSEFEAIAAQLIGKPTALRMVKPFSLTTLGGRPALKAAYVYQVGGVDVATVAYLAPVGKRAYWVTGQASRGTWNTSGRAIGASVATFSLKE
jgi:hypothetical protein